MSIVVIRSAAGCGKTTELCRRYLQFLEEDYETSQIIAITFTRQAAAELQTRIRQDIQSSTLPAAKRQRALSFLSQAPIGTTDHFVQQLLGEFVLDARLTLPNGEVYLDLPLQPDPAGVQVQFSQATQHLMHEDARIGELGRWMGVQPVLTRLSHNSILHFLNRGDLRTVLEATTSKLAKLLKEPEFESLLAMKNEVVTRKRLQRESEFLSSEEQDEVWSFFQGGPPTTALWYWLNTFIMRAPFRALLAQVSALQVPISRSSLTGLQLLKCFAPPFHTAANRQRAFAIQDQFADLQNTVQLLAFQSASEANLWNHDALLIAATDLVKRLTVRLHGRFRVLLVDEVQDANPAQLALYQALSDLCDHTVYVGDFRQSIYGFRHAEPNILAELVRRSDEQPVLKTNFRTTTQMVNAHHHLMSALQEAMSAHNFTPLDSLEQVLGEKTGPPDPIHVVFAGQEDPQRCTLDLFLGRLRSAWQDPAGEEQTAAVLCSTWSDAKKAASLLSNRLSDPSRVIIGGGPATLGRIASDLSNLLSALQNPDDDLAWLSLLKHPMFGLSDQTLAATLQNTSPGKILDLTALPEECPSTDRASFLAFRSPLIAAKEGLFARPPHDLLSDLIEARQGLTIYAASPGGEDNLAALATLLEFVRELHGRGISVFGICERLRGDLSHLRPTTQPRSGQILCTTIHQCKGLAFDHVCVLWRAKRGRAPDQISIQLLDEPLFLQNLPFDPTGGLRPEPCPTGRLLSLITKSRGAEEELRMLYVAITRARITCTILGPSPISVFNESSFSAIMRQGWSPDRVHLDGFVRAVEAVGEQPPTSMNMAVKAQYTHTWAPPLPAEITVTSPSAVTSGWSEQDLERNAELIVHKIRLFGGLYLGAPLRLTPPGVDSTNGLGISGHALEFISPTTWGIIAHHWIETWQFKGLPNQQAALEVVAKYPSICGPFQQAVALWLTQLASSIVNQHNSIYTLIQSPLTTSHFEWPFIIPQGNTLVNGKADLIISSRTGAWVIDFKAGHELPTNSQDLIEEAHLKHYGPQLEAYARALQATGTRVHGVGLWFLRTGTSVLWRP